ncbi:hypothetical protein HY029_03695 [Candidatus Gottesmanbacteria bacterium]|nr:hypothetical protein [Candidatus Gottesmanbacteria bacterium]
MLEFLKKHQRFFLFSLLLLGLILRITGLFFNGTFDMDPHLRWGTNTRVYGLAKGFEGLYFPIAYLIFAVASFFSALIPKLWFLPIKFANQIFEISTLILLIKLFPKKQFLILLIYWLNPWFIIEGAWLGYFDAGMAFFLLSAGIYLNRLQRANSFFVSGLLTSLALLIKPQVSGPLTVFFLFLLINFVLRKKFKETLTFTLGLAILPILFSIYFFISGKPIYYFAGWYTSLRFYMPSLNANQVNIWYTITRFIMYISGITGPIYSLNTLYYPYSLLEKLSFAVFFIIAFLYVRQLKNISQKHKISYLFLKLFAIGALLFPQIVTRSHENHFYNATILLTPLTLVNTRLLWPLIISEIFQFYNIFLRYGLGRDIRIPFGLNMDPLLSILGILQFIITLRIIYIFFSDGLHRRKLTIRHTFAKRTN